MTKEYSIKKDGNTKLSDNFSVREFACKDGSDSVLISDELVNVLQKIRNHFKKPVTINSAYRNKAYNKKIGGATYSQHIYGTAADIVVQGVKPEEVAKYAEYLMPKTGGIGLYPTFTHVDVRVARARWKNYGKEVGVSGFPGYKPKELTETPEIIAELEERGIVTNSPLWNVKCAADQNAYWLARKICNQTKMSKGRNPKLESVNDIVWELGERKVITDTHLWMKLFEEDKDLYWLGYKAVNMTVNV